MTNRHRTLLLGLLKLSDLVVVLAAFLAALCAAIPGERWVDVLEMRVQVRNALFLSVYLVYWHVVLLAFGLYRSHRLAPVAREWRDVLSAAFVAAAPLALVSVPLRLQFVAGQFLAHFVVFAGGGLLVERRLLKFAARTMRRHGHNLRHVIVVGEDRDALDMAAHLARRVDLGYHVVDVVETPDLPRQEEAVLARVARRVAQEPIDEVFVALPLDAGSSLIRRVIALCEEQGITVRVVASIVDLVLARAQVDEIDGQPVLTVFTGPSDSPSLAVKRVLDLTVSAVAMAVLAPVFALIALAIRLDSRGPVFFVQGRVGLGGRRFDFFKFRTMIPDAEERQAALEHLNEADGPVFKIRHDPRVTRVGRWLRRASLDELPQLLNVLRGDMSLVGPRPLPVRDVQRFDTPAHRRRFSVKPGITCLWQVERRVPEFDAWVKTDMAYIDNWSLGLDMKILLRTIPAVFSGRGAV
ncbi:MAG: sugar transferase [Candidatus Binatia bacterium]